MFRKVLVANRGVAAVRIADTLKRLGVLSIGLRTTEERGNKYFERFDEVYDLAGDSVSETSVSYTHLTLPTTPYV